MEASPRILVIRGGSLGDFVLTLPVFSALREQWLTAHIEVACYPAYVPLALDAGPSHVAAALGLPSLVLFGPSDAVCWCPRGPQVKVLRAANGRMDAIPAQEVMAELAGFDL